METPRAHYVSVNSTNKEKTKRVTIPRELEEWLPLEDKEVVRIEGEILEGRKRIVIEKIPKSHRKE